MKVLMEPTTVFKKKVLETSPCLRSHVRCFLNFDPFALLGVGVGRCGEKGNTFINLKYLLEPLDVAAASRPTTCPADSAEPEGVSMS